MEREEQRLPDQHQRDRCFLQLCGRGVRIETIGASVLGRPIRAAYFGKEEEPVVFVGGVHAQEWITTSLLLRFCREIARIDRTKDLWRQLDQRGLVVIPCLNPDGVELALHGMEAAGREEKNVRRISGGDTAGWQANIRGVDLNHNFDAGFKQLRVMEEEAGISKPVPRQYGGLFPFSEPETAALRDFCLKVRPCRAVAFHAQGEEIYYHYGSNTPSDAEQTGEIFAQMSGYRLCHPQGLASHGGFKDWFIEKTGRQGFTVEVGKGKNPLPIEQLMPIYKQIHDMMIGMIVL